jgi:hypothetical protein
MTESPRTSSFNEFCNKIGQKETSDPCAALLFSLMAGWVFCAHIEDFSRPGAQLMARL